jgi:UDP-N-acetylmuramoyl-tripeptide--D-alanyl-D-alanine ligase
VWTLEQIAAATSGAISAAASSAATTRLRTVETDTRAITSGALFVALRGERFDGHDYLEAAQRGGAAAALVSRGDALPGGLPAVVVSDTLEALQRLGAWHRRQMPASVVGLTGSAGKTTTKELTASILAEIGPTHKTRGNLNNHIGVPLTLLELRPEHRFAVIEMGCNDFGEIELLSRLAAPSAGLITNIGEAHLEKLGDLEGVARAKGELFAQLPEEGVAVVNLDDERLRRLPARSRRRLSYGEAPDAEVRLVQRRLERDGRQALVIELPPAADQRRRLEVTIRLLGAHNAKNALAAAALSLVAGADREAIRRGLEAATAAPGRLELKATTAGVRLIDDTYNANPGAMRAALELLGEYRGSAARVVAVLGKMLELGSGSDAQHLAVGRFAAERGVDLLVAVGEVAPLYARGGREGGLDEAQILSVDSPEEAALIIEERARPRDLVLIKGSRGAHMERTISALDIRGEEGEV